MYCIEIRRGELSAIFKKRVWGQFWGLDSQEDPPEDPLGRVLWGSPLGGVLWRESSKGVLGIVYCIEIRRGKLSPILSKRLWGQFWGLDSPEDPPVDPLGRVLWGSSLEGPLGGVL
jgi:hypothetical protein